MKKELIYEICRMMSPHLSIEQNIQLEKTLKEPTCSAPGKNFESGTHKF